MYLASLPLREDAEEHRTVSPALLALLQTTECSEVMFAPSHLPYVVAELASGVAEAEFQYSLQEASHAITLSLCQSYVQAHNFDPSVLIPLRGAFRPFGVDAGDISIAGTIKGALSQFFALYGEHARLAASHSIDLLRSLHERYLAVFLQLLRYRTFLFFYYYFCCYLLWTKWLSFLCLCV